MYVKLSKLRVTVLWTYLRTVSRCSYSLLPASVLRVGVAADLDFAASQAFFLARRGSLLFSARSVAVRLQRLARESDERDMCGIGWIKFDGLALKNIDEPQLLRFTVCFFFIKKQM